MEQAERIAIIDIGKTNSRAILADLVTRQEMDIRAMENRVLPGPPYPHLDTDRIADFILRALADFARVRPALRVLIIGHGATMAVVDDVGLALPVMDYEYAGPDDLAAEYDRQRPDFAETGAPRMPGGLNLGAQLFWLARHHAQELSRARHALFWPQYWTWYLTGHAFSEISYATSHSDLWSLRTGQPAVGAMSRIMSGLFPPIAPAAAIAGTIRPALAAAYGLPDGISVHVGAHDSSLALVPHAGSGRRAPSVAMSTGTWLAGFAIGVEKMPAPGPGIMASLDIFGRLVPNFRIMAGKARADLLDGHSRTDLPARPADELALYQDKTGRFGLHDSDCLPARLATRPDESAADAVDRLLARDALAGLYAIGASGPLHVTGPFAKNPVFMAALRQGWRFPARSSTYAQSIVDQVAALLDGPEDRPVS
ncbi:hypothetical protein FQV27_16480 [Paracoccus aurantiacus]|uniref:Uncharacterized protein n=1 Tax=Paracoccus aurantiacus TaxID=2599412 RepID=A0A5C6RUP2_9RHOB|nr:FGGY family carbohydrate kinase [Paracoccus aurantiacus]TXB65649.1 hypothetical protein FQV27_16480 [Paracoccus aurantiacus]